jgi:2-amino-4-hydroxy-6-hydroxymethyldihydropteridine diphosphokinase
VDESVAYIGVGSNLDDPARQVRSAIDALSRLPRSRLLHASRLFRTEPWGRADQPEFINAAVALATRLSPRELLDALLAIERERGRHRDGTRWGPRVIDLDLLMHGDLRIEEDGLRIPHPEIAERAFVLLPLADLDAELEVPGQGRVRDLLLRTGTAGCVPLPASGAA